MNRDVEIRTVKGQLKLVEIKKLPIWLGHEPSIHPCCSSGRFHRLQRQYDSGPTLAAVGREPDGVS